ncbi:alanine--tRNA ligase, mitochondrial-like [Vitis riparia]|uniref:alanine--tRNA ligase, mitochondrial-like n=1 Tax=Vitis riparia TaxID=96939 RepID=UPI00155B32B4|nr:alanine--tRNA ligase, mitochondrial-like [Vitis riparia]
MRHACRIVRGTYVERVAGEVHVAGVDWVTYKTGSLALCFPFISVSVHGLAYLKQLEDISEGLAPRYILFNRERDGYLKSLPAKHVNAGTGFERLNSILQGKTSNCDTDALLLVFDAIQQATDA